VAEIAIVHSRTRKDAVAVQPAANDPAPPAAALALEVIEVIAPVAQAETHEDVD